jgi:hypothetical protein
VPEIVKVGIYNISTRVDAEIGSFGVWFAGSDIYERLVVVIRFKVYEFIHSVFSIIFFGSCCGSRFGRGGSGSGGGSGFGSGFGRRFRQVSEL